MRDVAIVGAGPLGGAVAHRLASRDLAASVVLLDGEARVAAGKALDMMQAAPIEGFSTAVHGSGDFSGVLAADVVIFADRCDGREWNDDEALALLARLAAAVRTPMVIFAGATQLALIERTRELSLQPRNLIGSAPEALASGARALTALYANCPPRDVALTLLGIPPAQLIIPWDECTVGGFAATRLLEAHVRRAIAARVAALWPPGPLALAAAAANVVGAVVGGARSMATCFVPPGDGVRRRVRTVARPARIGPEGAVAVDLPPLTVHDQVALDNVMLV